MGLTRTDFTQTRATETHVVAASAIADLSGSLTGTNDSALTNLGSSYDGAATNANFKEIQTKLNAILAALRSAGIIASS